jgi:hypothetical protein
LSRLTTAGRPIAFDRRMLKPLPRPPLLPGLRVAAPHPAALPNLAYIDQGGSAALRRDGATRAALRLEAPLARPRRSVQARAHEAQLNVRSSDNEPHSPRRSKCSAVNSPAAATSGASRDDRLAGQQTLPCEPAASFGRTPLRLHDPALDVQRRHSPDVSCTTRRYPPTARFLHSRCQQVHSSYSQDQHATSRIRHRTRDARLDM